MAAILRRLTRWPQSVGYPGKGGQLAWDGCTWLISDQQHHKISLMHIKSMKSCVGVLALTHHRCDTAEEGETPPPQPGSASLMGATFGKSCRKITLKFHLSTNSLPPNHITETNIDNSTLQNYWKGESSWRSHLQPGPYDADPSSALKAARLKQTALLKMMTHLHLQVCIHLWFWALNVDVKELDQTSDATDCCWSWDQLCSLHLWLELQQLSG